MKSWIRVVLVLVAVGGALAVFFFWESKRLAAMTTEAQAVVTTATLDKDDDSSSLDSTIVEYDFAVAGTPRHGSDSLPGDKVGDYPPGRGIAICYDPDDHSHTSIRTGPDRCGG